MWGTDVDHPENDYPESLREVIFILSTASSAVGTTREQLVTGPIAAPLSIYAIWRLGQLLCDLNVAGSPEAAVRHRDMIAAYVMLGIRCPSANDVQAANIEMTALRRWLDLLLYQFSDGGYPLCLSVSFRVSVHGTGMLRDQHHCCALLFKILSAFASDGSVLETCCCNPSCLEPFLGDSGPMDVSDATFVEYVALCEAAMQYNRDLSN